MQPLTETRVPLAFIRGPAYPPSTFSLQIFAFDTLGHKIILFTSWCNPLAVLAPHTTIPVDGLFGLTPFIRTGRFLHPRSQNLQGDFEMILWFRTPNGWHGVMLFNVMICVSPAVFGIVVNKDARVPTSIEFSRSTMEHLRRLIKQQVSA
jgi:hypothetical protein